MRVLYRLFGVLAFTACAQTGDLATVDQAASPAQIACREAVKSEALAEDWSTEDYEAELHARCGPIADAEPDPCVEAVKAEAIAAAEAGTPYDYEGELGARCGVDLPAPSEDIPEEPLDPAAVECANTVKAEAIAAEAVGTPYDYAAELASRCGIVITL